MKDVKESKFKSDNTSPLIIVNGEEISSGNNFIDPAVPKGFSRIIKISALDFLLLQNSQSFGTNNV